MQSGLHLNPTFFFIPIHVSFVIFPDIRSDKLKYVPLRKSLFCNETILQA